MLKVVKYIIHYTPFKITHFSIIYTQQQLSAPLYLSPRLAVRERGVLLLSIVKYDVIYNNTVIIFNHIILV